MSSGQDALHTVREELIRLLEGEELEQWRITRTALENGRRILPNYRGHFGTYALNLFILDLLRQDFPMHEVELGSGGRGWVMNNADGTGLYIKLTIDEGLAVILSCHVSIHQRGS